MNTNKLAQCQLCGAICHTNSSKKDILGKVIYIRDLTADDEKLLAEAKYLSAEDDLQRIKMRKSGGLQPDGAPGKRLMEALWRRNEALLWLISTGNSASGEITSLQLLEEAETAELDALREEKAAKYGPRRCDYCRYIHKPNERHRRPDHPRTMRNLVYGPLLSERIPPWSPTSLKLS